MKNQQLLRKCATYSNIEATMRDYESAYLGGLTFKSRVRKKRPSEDEKLHTDVVNNTAALPVARYVVDTINDTVFSEPIYRDLEFATPEGVEIDNDALTDWSELVCYDADLSYRSMDQFMAQVGELTSIFGHCWVFVDMPAQGIPARPYVVALSPLQVWDWAFTEVNGRYIPSYIKVCEYEDNYEYHFKCYYLGTTTEPSYWCSYRVSRAGAVSDAEAEKTGEGYYPPGMSIPGFLAYTRRDTRSFEIGVSDIDSASDVQRELYKLETEAYQSIQFAKSIIRADAGIKIPAYAGAIVRANEGQIETLDIDTQDVDRIIAKQQDLLTSLENLSGLGGLRVNRSQPQSGISIIEERSQLHKIAKAKAREMEICEEQIWTYMARFMGLRWAGEVLYGTNYAEHDTRMKIAKLETARRLSPTNPVIGGIIDRKVLEMLVDEDELANYEQLMLQAGTSIVEEQEDMEDDTEIEASDLGPQTPDSLDEQTLAIQAGTNDTSYTDVGITYTGISSYDPIADALVARASGR